MNWYTWSLLFLLFSFWLNYAMTPYEAGGMGIFTPIAGMQDACYTSTYSELSTIGSDAQELTDVDTLTSSGSSNIFIFGDILNLGKGISTIGKIALCSLTAQARLEKYGIPSMLAWMLQLLAWVSYAMGFVQFLRGINMGGLI